ncbi:Protein-L-isoaspartate(D-aspartate) O-methyltransferase [Apophysomyces sp. BC1034]|nr:Protein-L-isoaspartate(D-aspartate) O-methyltransferase [Apophysomyces sp. BC1034]
MSNVELVENLRRASIITSARVVNAMKAIDSPHIVACSHMHGYALDKLQDYLKPGMKALDVGSGSGYLVACMAEMVGPEGQAIGIDHISELVDMSKRNVSTHHADWLESGRVKLVTGDGRKGFPEQAPYDCIHVGAAASKTPTELINQLKAPGRLFIPVGTMSQSIMLIDKKEDGSIEEKKWLGVMYVPLTDEDKQREYGI